MKSLPTIKHKPTKMITHEQVQAAIERWLAAGGTILLLPPQTALRYYSVGSGKVPHGVTASLWTELEYNGR